MDWQYSVSDPTVLAQEPKVPLPSGTVAIFKALKPGTARIFADGDPRCLHSHPACLMPSIALDLTIIVQ